MGSGEAFLCGGVESMSRVKRGGFNRSPNPSLEASYPEAYISMGLTAENVAQKYSITRVEQEELAFESHRKAATAFEEGLLKDEIIPITTSQGIVDSDECIRPGTNMESMAKLKPAFIENGTVTAATSSPLTDGAAFTFICSENYADEYSLKPLARVIGSSVSGCAPDLMGIGPVNSTKKLLK